MLSFHTTKGIGHGFGYDQYYGNLLAEQGQDYQEILHYFYQNIELANIGE